MGASPVTLPTDIGRLILRVTLAALLLFHGIDKIVHGIAWMQRPLAALHLPFFVAYGVYVGEVVAPLLVLLGLGTRLAAGVIALNMVMALVLEAGRNILTIQPAGGWGIELEAFYMLVAVVVALVGPGRFALAPGKL
jgi:putative oxidoreductase